MPRPVFVTGTDTCVGKTVVCAWLVNQFKLDYWKPVQCGDLDNTDTMQVAALSGYNGSDNQFRIHPETYKFRHPLSPHLASQKEGIDIDLASIAMPVTANRLIIEGAGGVLVPLNKQHTMVDLIKRFNALVLVVSRGTLGTINHTCLTLEALRLRKLTVSGVIISGITSQENKQAIEYFGRTRVLAELPYIQPLSAETLGQYGAGDHLLRAVYSPDFNFKERTLKPMQQERT